TFTIIHMGKPLFLISSAHVTRKPTGSLQKKSPRYARRFFVDFTGEQVNHESTKARPNQRHEAHAGSPAASWNSLRADTARAWPSAVNLYRRLRGRPIIFGSPPSQRLESQLTPSRRASSG